MRYEMTVTRIRKAEQKALKISTFRANPTKETSKPLPTRVSFCAKNLQIYK